MQKTPNYGFDMPEENDFIDCDDWARMMMQVDTELKKQESYNKLAGMFIGGKELSAEATVTDERARYPVIQKTSSTSAEVKVLEKEIAIPQGLYSVMLRIKLSDNASSNNLIKIKTTLNSASGALLKEAYIKPSMLDARDTYQTFGFCVEQNGTKSDKLFLSVSMLQTHTQNTLSVDYVVISPAYVAVSAIG